MEDHRSGNLATMALSIVAVAVSLASVGVAWMQTHAAQKQVEAAEEQNDELRTQFAQAGPVLVVSSQLRIEVGEVSDKVDEGDATYKDSEAPVVNAQLINENTAVYFVIEISNSGRSATTVQSVGLKTGDDYYTFAEQIQPSPDYIIYCAKAEAIETENCLKGLLPYVLEPGRMYQVYFPITPSLHETMTVNDVDPDNLTSKIRAVGISQQPLQYVSEVAVSR